MTDCQDEEGLFTVKWHLAESAIHDVTLSLSWRSYSCLYFNLDCYGPLLARRHAQFVGISTFLFSPTVAHTGAALDIRGEF
jgi:hypothetical protein